MEQHRVALRQVGLAMVFVAGALVGCLGPQTASEHSKSLGSESERRLTLGVVQTQIRVGMSQADVATALGSPNIVTPDAQGNETWIYDKISTESSESSSGMEGGAGLPLVGGIFGSKSSSARSQSQRTLTVVIKFDSNRRVVDVKTQATSF